MSAMSFSSSPFCDTLSEEKQALEAWFLELQGAVCAMLERFEEPEDASPNVFVKEPWPYQNGDPKYCGGGGVSAHLRGKTFEKAAVHFSSVWGVFPPEFQSSIPGTEKDPRFYATGLSLIVHPFSPHVPTVHFNTRFLATSRWWFGGGADLTPMLEARRTQEDPDTRAFHQAMRGACVKHPCADYTRYKEWCDTYFFLPHRKEPRGIGGIFFDNHNSGDWQADFAFIQDVGRAFLHVYPEIVARNRFLPFSQAEKRAQGIRRGRYVEFNLLYDRGTLFGLKTGGNVDTILSSMPPHVLWP